ncbi:hypothetical protein Daus18300_012857 [Diaporthe australafricana]|uniref:Ribosome biogenesis protein SLX9 n=1 Tax=Diaporthe australafricana TaxID=127596 RepID=A0ABR3W186_9PEZI
MAWMVDIGPEHKVEAKQSWIQAHGGGPPRPIPASTAAILARIGASRTQKTKQTWATAAKAVPTVARKTDAAQNMRTAGSKPIRAHETDQRKLMRQDGEEAHEARRSLKATLLRSLPEDIKPEPRTIPEHKITPLLKRAAE